MQQPLQHAVAAQPSGTMYATGPNGQMYPVNIPQVPVAGYLAVLPSQSNTVLSFKSGQSVYLGSTLVISGVLAIIFNIVGILSVDMISVIGHGIWCGAMFIVTGGFGIGAKNKNSCMIVTFMTLCIISSVFTIVLLGLAIPMATENSQCQTCEYCYRRCNKVVVAMGSLLAILAFIAAVSSIWGAVICCRAVCCCATSTTGVMQPQYSHQQVMLITPQGTQQGVQYAPVQVMMSPAQPVYSPPVYCQPPVPQQQTWIPPAQQPVQLVIPGTSADNVFPSAPADGFSRFDQNLSPPAYSETVQEKR